jgi:hypothetical protein
MPPGARLSLRHLLRFTTLHADEAAQARDRRRARRKDCIRQSRSISAGFTFDEPNAALGTAIMSPPRTRPRAAGIIAALAPLRRPQTRQSVAPPPRRCSRKILSYALVAQSVPSLRARSRSNYDCA